MLGYDSRGSHYPGLLDKSPALSLVDQTVSEVDDEGRDVKRRSLVFIFNEEAYRKAQEIRGKADAQAADIYAAAYNRDPDFYRFLKSMDTLRQSVDPETTLVLSTDGDLLRYLNAAK